MSDQPKRASNGQLNSLLSIKNRQYKKKQSLKGDINVLSEVDAMASCEYSYELDLYSMNFLYCPNNNTLQSFLLDLLRYVEGGVKCATKNHQEIIMMSP